jgi:hypothetical protein
VNKQIFGLQNYDSILFNPCSPDERSEIRDQHTSLGLPAHASKSRARIIASLIRATRGAKAAGITRVGRLTTFGFAIGAVYGALMAFHIVLTIFGALFVVCLGRGIVLYVCELAPVRKMQERLWSAFFGRAAPATVPATPAD